MLGHNAYEQANPGPEILVLSRFSVLQFFTPFPLIMEDRLYINFTEDYI